MIYLTDHARGVQAHAALAAAPPPVALTPDAATGALLRPFGLCFVPRRALLVADAGHDRIVLLPLKAGASRAIGAQGSPSGPLRGPRGVARLADDRLLVADTGGHRLRVSGFTLRQWAAGRADPADWQDLGQPVDPADAGPLRFHSPQSVLVNPGGRLYASDPALGRLVRLDGADGSGWAEIELPAAARPPQPYGLSPGPNGGLLLTDLVNARVIFVAPDDRTQVLIDGAAQREPGHRLVAPVAAVMHGRSLVVADAAAARLTEWTRSSRGLWQWRRMLRGAAGPAGTRLFDRLVGLASSTTSPRLGVIGAGPL